MKVLEVTPAQVAAAQLQIQLMEEDGETPDEAIVAIANAEVREAREIYVLIIEDRHSDVEVEVYEDELAAKRAFENFIRVQSVGARRPEDIEEYLTDDMIKNGWLANVIYSVEGDAARIEKQVLR